MANVVVSGGTLTCSHQGKITLSGSAKLQSGGPVVPFSSVPKATKYDGCGFTTSAGNTPCQATTVVGQGQASKLTVGGAPALLDNLVATTENPPSTVSVSAGQSKLTAS